MFTLNPALTVRLHRDPVDFRSGINGLCAIVEHALKLDPLAPAWRVPSAVQPYRCSFRLIEQGLCLQPKIFRRQAGLSLEKTREVRRVRETERVRHDADGH
jgi:hypothetical protein